MYCCEPTALIQTHFTHSNALSFVILLLQLSQLTAMKMAQLFHGDAE